MPGYYDIANLSMPTTKDVMGGVRENRRAKGRPQRGKVDAPRYNLTVGEPQIEPGQPNMTLPPMTMRVPDGGGQDPRAAMVRELMGQGLSYRDAMAKVAGGGPRTFTSTTGDSGDPLGGAGLEGLSAGMPVKTTFYPKMSDEDLAILRTYSGRGVMGIKEKHLWLAKEKARLASGGKPRA